MMIVLNASDLVLSLELECWWWCFPSETLLLMMIVSETLLICLDFVDDDGFWNWLMVCLDFVDDGFWNWLLVVFVGYWLLVLMRLLVLKLWYFFSSLLNYDDALFWNFVCWFGFVDDDYSSETLLICYSLKLCCWLLLNWDLLKVFDWW